MPAALIWAPLAPSHPLAQALGLREMLHVPFLATGEDAEQVHARGPGEVAFGPRHLLFGILAGYHEIPPSLDAGALRQRLLPVMDGLWREFGMASREQAVLDVAATLREGAPDTARAVLRTGRALLPRSSRVASDYVMALWEHARVAHPEARAAVWADLHAAAAVVDYNDVMPPAREGLAFMHFTAVRCLGDEHAIGRVLHEGVFVHVARPRLKAKIKRALEDPAPDPEYLYS